MKINDHVLTYFGDYGIIYDITEASLEISENIYAIKLDSNHIRYLCEDCFQLIPRLNCPEYLK